MQVVDERALLGGHAHLRGAVALVHPLGEALEQLDLRDGRLVVLGFLLEARHRALDGAEVGEHELGADRLDVARRVHAALDVDDVLVGEVADDLADRVGLADVGEELVAEALALARALHEAGDVHELDDRGHDALRVDDLGERVEARVGHGDEADVGLDGGEGVVRRDRRLAGECGEQRGLAHVGKADDTERKCHEDDSFELTPTAARSREPVYSDIHARTVTPR